MNVDDGGARRERAPQVGEMVLPECARWVVHDLDADGACTRCGWRWRLLINGVAMADSAGWFPGESFGTFVVGLRDEDGGPCVLIDATLTPAATTRACEPGDEPWPPAIDMITRAGQTHELYGGAMTLWEPDRVIEFRAVA